MTSLTNYHMQLCMIVAMCGLCGGVLGMMVRLGSHVAAATGLVAGVVAGVAIAVYPAYTDTSAGGYEEVVRLRDHDPRLAGEVAKSLSDGMLSRYEHQRIVHMADDLAAEDAAGSGIMIKRRVIAQEKADRRAREAGCSEEVPVSTDTEGKIG